VGGIFFPERRQAEAGGMVMPKRGDPDGGPGPMRTSAPILAFEESIRNKPYEIAAVFTTDGRLVFMAGYGRRRMTGFTDAQIARMRGRILTHNHPDLLTNPFSLHDVRIAAEAGVAELRVAGESNTYSLSPGEDGWPDPETIVRCHHAVTADPAFSRRVSCAVVRLLLTRPLFARDEEKIENLLRWREIARRLGLIFTMRYPPWLL
jgi:hypothetical protein